MPQPAAGISNRQQLHKYTLYKVRRAIYFILRNEAIELADPVPGNCSTFLGPHVGNPLYPWRRLPNPQVKMHEKLDVRNCISHTLT